MADISKLNGYTIRDDTARSQINTINNVTIPAINNRIDNITGDKHIIENAHIVFAGDSNWGFGSEPLAKMLELMPGCTGENIHVGGGSWENIYAQVTGYGGTPDVFLLNAGGNSINNNGITAADIGGILGAPDVRDHTVPDVSVTANQTVFNYMKATFNYIRNTWPRCLIYVVIRANQPFKPRSAWYYWKFYEQQICQEWGVPVIDANNILNQTYWNDAQKAIYNQSDEQHYTTEAYNRYLPGIAALLESFAAVQFSQAPNNFFVPRSVINTSYTATDLRNTRSMVEWVILHCCPAYCAAWSCAGRVQAYMTSGTAATGRFVLEECNYNTVLEADARGLIIGENNQRYGFVYKTYTGQNARELYDLEAYHMLSGSESLQTLPSGTYFISDTQVETYKTLGELPDTIGSAAVITVRRSRHPLDPISEGYRIYTLVTRVRSFYTGSNAGGGTITWALHS